MHDKCICDVEVHHCLKGIRKLAVCLCPRVAARWSSFLLESDIHATLEDLELSIIREFPIVQLPNFPALRFLKLRFEIGALSLWEPLYPILSALAASAPLLQSATVIVQFPPALVVEWTIDPDPHPMFHSAGALRRSPPHLAEFQCSWSGDVASCQGVAFAEYVQRKLRGAEAAGILAISYLRSVDISV
ncbi:hypothetical protein B0H15DRAFT_518546 [Mycena belliarum]|uniref:Uncharacterized protein n=1 Tax=Mycena belliarum TaxID=1033014 RepID=A0AAD6XLD8_9AGAR|nr:hypothetical protein B0H15DRAFT_518546 [Mycena belliae]